MDVVLSGSCSDLDLHPQGVGEEGVRKVQVCGAEDGRQIRVCHNSQRGFHHIDNLVKFDFVH